MKGCQRYVRFTPDSVAKLFPRPNRPTLIRERTQTRNIDSKRRSVGFDCCALAMQRRLLQHNPPESRHQPTNRERPLRSIADIASSVGVSGNGSGTILATRLLRTSNLFEIVCLLVSSHLCHWG